jgi:hypothetical protein
MSNLVKLAYVEQGYTKQEILQIIHFLESKAGEKILKELSWIENFYYELVINHANKISAAENTAKDLETLTNSRETLNAIRLIRSQLFDITTLDGVFKQFIEESDQPALA